MKALRAMRDAYWRTLGEWGGIVVGSLLVIWACGLVGDALNGALA